MIRTQYLLLSFILILAACSQQATQLSKKTYHDLSIDQEEGYLIRVPIDDGYVMGDSCAYINEKGDTIVPKGKYSLCWTDTIHTYGIVMGDNSKEFIAIDRAGRKLYEVYFYDNGPDWVAEGLFRIMRDGKIGYADAEGHIRIQPQFECASQFEEGVAKVAYQCELIPDGEYTITKSEEWFYINKEGEKVKY